ncbi:RND family efflux transporter, MFP subunit [Cupriavidus sp. YR651]|uniref:efflux RND transporter periplasmic adaptor subunit n=1 Tax=Cupriavidus sp. YR651 TaxID=1855315 RepID=UPI0008821DA2|nr:efflux RND transporter periplasmic adaptor subunit [Cupriavidus sp. YR651]SDD01686.1 RND family efflux transporter, MFP subunit [Cupriavidus sp. YR651]
MKQRLNAGALKRVVLAAILSLSVVAIVTGCKSEATAEPAAQAVVVSQPVVRQVTDVDIFTGRFEAIDTVEVRSRVGGYLEKIAFKDGAIVKKGDLLFVVDPRPFQATVTEAEGALARARSQLSLSLQEYERAKVLISTNTIARSLFDQREQAVQGARAEVASAEGVLSRAKLDLSFTRITAPMSGRISRKLVSEGNLITGGNTSATLLTTIVSQDPIDFYFDVDEQSYLRYTRDAGGGQATAREVRISLPGDTQPSLVGGMNFIDNRLDNSTGTLRQRVRLANPQLKLTPGQFGRAHVAGNGAHQALLVPDVAVATDATRRVLYIVKPDQTVEVRPVELGRLFGNLREVSTGLKAGENVIVEGAQRVRPGEMVKVTTRAAARQDDLQASKGVKP